MISTLVLRFSSYLSFLIKVKSTKQTQRTTPNSSTSKGKMVSMTKGTSAYKTIIGHRDKTTRLNGIITPEGVDKLKDKLGSICMIIKTHHYTEGQKYGQLASIIPQNKYRIVIGNATWVHAVPANPGAYSTAALGIGNVAAQREQLVAKQKVLQASYTDYLGMEEAAKELILYAVGSNALAPHKKQYTGFGDTTVRAMINHFCLKTAIRMTTAQKYKYKTMGYNTPWDPTTSITAYFTHLGHFQISLGDQGIATSNNEKTMAAGAQMWQSKMFSEDQMVVWENRAVANQTWPNLQAYFTEKWLKRKQYLATTAKQSQFKEAALLAQETAAAKEEGETQVMLFAMLQEQQDKQMETVAATNKANMDTMIEQMSTMLAVGGSRRNNGKENAPPAANNNVPGGDETKKPKQKRICAPAARCLFSTAQKNVTSWRPTKTHATKDGSQPIRWLDMRRGPKR